MNKVLDTRFYQDKSDRFSNTCEFDKAVVIFKRLIAMGHKSNAHHYNWAQARGDQEEYRFAELKFREVMILDPEDHGALNSLGIVFSKQGKLDEAISVFERAFHINPKNYDLPLNMAITYTMKGDYEEANEWYAKALDTRPSEKTLHNAMGYLCFLQGKYTEAILKFDDALRIDANYEMPFFNKAMTFFCQGHMQEESKNAFEHGIQSLAAQGYQSKSHRLKVSVSIYNSEMDRVRKELESGEMGSEMRVNLEKIQKGLEYILDLLVDSVKNSSNTVLFDVNNE